MCTVCTVSESQRSTKSFCNAKAEVPLPLGTPALMFPALGGLTASSGFISFGFERHLAALTSLVSSEVGRRGPGWLPSRRADSRPAESSYCREVGEEVWPGCDDGKKNKKKKPQRSGCSVKLQKCYGKKKKKLSGREKQSGPRGRRFIVRRLVTDES